MKTIFLDFDGVLFDSAKEGYLISRYAYSGIDVKEEIDEHCYKIFHKNRYLIHNSWQYFYIMELLDKNLDDMRESFLQCLQNRNKLKEDEFNKKFIEKRKDLIVNHYDFWINLDKPYGFFHEIKKLSTTNDFDFVIISTKNKIAIETLLEKYEFNIDSNKIFGKEILASYKNKAEFLENYIISNTLDNTYFIEDNKENLDACVNINGLKTFLVNWGYINPKESGCSEKFILEEILK